ncbi:hypothetical protein ES708_35123 [subsurface metagenome]
MSKRIFTKHLSGTARDESTGWLQQDAIQSWLVQEDIEVIGFQLITQVLIADQNDDLAEIIGELSQTGLFGQEGLIGQVTGAHLWNSVPASVDRECPVVTVMFPEGLAIPVKEEGHIYINATAKGAAATHTTWLIRATIYYIKRGG